MDIAKGGTARRRLRCRLALHETELYTAQDFGRPLGTEVFHPCRHERRCPYCGWVRRTGLIHDYGDARPTDHPCRTVRACTRCGVEDETVRHEFYRYVPVADLPADKRPRYTSPHEKPTPCDYARFCRRCDLMDFHHVTEHDWDRPQWGGVCRRCRERWVDDGDD
ncbi:hypothetical protein HUT18_15050 [Streptomyces sp. NA04227]|uniref:hypothetical protein n=1 Tax=Streptomyces sp. NA04227 TaxID=2742136 RepID=UPI00158FC450|nr:hypothetical protein [Streptomyces sp. NA04227]QKW07504.1 hypothetical protein HUT18_15050 [Streptomyces sp. NA04227]